jgi:hypothetical protein
MVEAGRVTSSNYSSSYRSKVQRGFLRARNREKPPTGQPSGPRFMSKKATQCPWPSLIYWSTRWKMPLPTDGQTDIAQPIVDDVHHPSSLNLLFVGRGIIAPLIYAWIKLKDTSNNWHIPLPLFMGHEVKGLFGNRMILSSLISWMQIRLFNFITNKTVLFAFCCKKRTTWTPDQFFFHIYDWLLILRIFPSNFGLESDITLPPQKN